VIHKPGISLQTISKRFPVLTPSEISHLLELMELDGKLLSRKVRVAQANLASCFSEPSAADSDSFHTYFFPTATAL